MILSQVENSQILATAFNNFSNKGRFSEAQSIIGKIKEQGLDSLSPEEVAALKGTRKHAAVLRAVLNIASEKHKNPSDFESFVRDFGRLNDMIAIGKNREAQDLAMRVLENGFDIEKMQKKNRYRLGRVFKRISQGIAQRSS